jgi:L-alanine-DL-glutamate epimerase-like enolase superfamily enzyme
MLPVPLHRLLGGAKRMSIPCYASLLRYAEPGLITKYCERALSEGYMAIKLHEVADAAVTAGLRAVPGLFERSDLAVPDGPGLGRNPDPDVLRRYRV